MYNSLEEIITGAWNYIERRICMTIDKIQDIIRKIDMFANESNIQITPFKSFEDDSTYDVWLIDCTLGKFVLKKVKNVEVEIYATFFKNKIKGVPRFFTKINDCETTYIVIEYIEGKTLFKCDRESLKKALDALISIQERYWNDPIYNDVGYTFEMSMQSRINRGQYLADDEIESAYNVFLSLYAKLPRTLCHDDFLPFNAIVSNNCATIIDWEYAGILPYPVSIARLIAHTEEDENSFFYMTNDDKNFAIQYYYDNLVSKYNISYDEYEYTLDLFLLYEYCEWIMLGNKYPNADNKERFQVYLNKAKEHLKNINLEAKWV